LKFLTYARYGFMGYDSDMDEYLEPETEEKKKYGANAINTIHMAHGPRLHAIVAMDSLFTYWLYEDLTAELQQKDCLSGYKFFIEAQKALDRATMNGMRLDEKKMAEHKAHLTSLLQPLYEKIMNHSVVVSKWDGGY